MFERFTNRARQVVVVAQAEARTLRHSCIGTEHILLGLLGVEDGLAAQVLGSLGITADKVRAQIACTVGQGDEVTTRQIPFTPRAKKVLELAQLEGLRRIGTEHILLSLVRESEGAAAQILRDFDANAERIREQILAHLENEPVQEEQQHPGHALSYDPYDPTLAVPIAEIASSAGSANCDLDTQALIAEIDAAVRMLTIRELLQCVTSAKLAMIEEQRFGRAAELQGVERRIVMRASDPPGQTKESAGS